MEFKIGEKVKVKSLEELKKINNFLGVFISDMEKYVNDIVTIKDIDNKGVWFEENQWTWDIRAIEKIKITKEKVLSMPIGTKIITDAKDENYKVWTKISNEKFANCYGYIIDDYEINKNLTLSVNEKIGTKIIEIEKPIFEKIYEAPKIKKMTVSEICEELGYDVEIVKED